MGYKVIFYSLGCRILLWKLCAWALAGLATKGWGEGNIQPKLEEGCVVYQVFCSKYIKEKDFAFFNPIYHFTRQIVTSRPDWSPVVSFDLKSRVTSVTSQNKCDDGKDISFVLSCENQKKIEMRDRCGRFGIPTMIHGRQRFGPTS